jgi:CMP-N-acetylneuraminic acid synthetase
MTESAVAIIPARGGSKGIPRKNVKPLAGKPLITYAIEAAKAARHVQRVIVSTDDSEIEAVANQFGAEVISRPAEIAGDLASSESALIHALETLRDIEGGLPELVAFVQCTSPLTAPEDIDGTIEALLARAADSALAVTPFHHFLWKESADGNAEGVNHDRAVRLMRQQREREYLETGAVYVMRVDGFLEHRHRFFGKTVMHVLPAERVLEIDEPFDFLLAETRLRHLRR